MPLSKEEAFVLRLLRNKIAVVEHVTSDDVIAEKFRITAPVTDESRHASMRNLVQNLMLVPALKNLAFNVPPSLDFLDNPLERAVDESLGADWAYVIEFDSYNCGLNRALAAVERGVYDRWRQR